MILHWTLGAIIIYAAGSGGGDMIFLFKHEGGTQFCGQNIGKKYWRGGTGYFSVFKKGVMKKILPKKIKSSVPSWRK